MAARLRSGLGPPSSPPPQAEQPPSPRATRRPAAGRTKDGGWQAAGPRGVVSPAAPPGTHLGGGRATPGSAAGTVPPRDPSGGGAARPGLPPPARGIPVGPTTPPHPPPGNFPGPGAVPRPSRGTPAALTSSRGGRWGSFSRQLPSRPAAGGGSRLEGARERAGGSRQPPLRGPRRPALLSPVPVLLLLPPVRNPDLVPAPPAVHHHGGAPSVN